MGVLYVKKGQQTPKEWFSNGLSPDLPLSPLFWEFMNKFGHEINLATWTGYFGDMGAKGKTYYTKWDDTIDCIFHLAPMMDAEGHRRLIGNDIGILNQESKKNSLL